MITLLSALLLSILFQEIIVTSGFSNDALLIFTGIMVLSLANEWKSNK